MRSIHRGLLVTTLSSVVAVALLAGAAASWVLVSRLRREYFEVWAVSGAPRTKGRERSVSLSRSDRDPTGTHVNAHSHAIGSASPGLFNKRSQPPARAYSGRRAIAHGHGTAQFPDRLVAFDTFQSNRKTPKPVYMLQHLRRTRA